MGLSAETHSGSNRGLGPLAILTFALLVLPGLAFGQAVTGNLYARATDDGGQPLPGANVNLSGIGAPVTRPTNQNGEVRFLDLSPGTYSLEFILPGFTSESRKEDRDRPLPRLEGRADVAAMMAGVTLGG
ncbi:MAG TPA: carboxypeptidase-like regulatory domain-containing protein [Thermoanaerobaculia bacterium]|nr:carboxypeptidase-like regulatory domain-containing protein [Thermoanaerobaculia bacterium]